MPSLCGEAAYDDGVPGQIAYERNERAYDNHGFEFAKIVIEVLSQIGHDDGESKGCDEDHDGAGNKPIISLLKMLHLDVRCYENDQ